MKSRPVKKRCPECPDRCFCGRSRELEDNHLGGRNHVPWLWLPNCGIDHAQFHVMCRRAGVDFRTQNDDLTGKIHALKAELVGMWMVVDSMEKHVKGKREKSK